MLKLRLNRGEDSVERPPSEGIPPIVPGPTSGQLGLNQQEKQQMLIQMKTRGIKKKLKLFLFTSKNVFQSR